MLSEMEEESFGKFSYQAIFNYLKDGTYPGEFTALIDGDVHLYDSSFQGQLTASAELQIAQMYRPLIAQHGLLLAVVPMQQQEEGSNNCGLFNIAAAYHAAKRPRDNIAAIT